MNRIPFKPALPSPYAAPEIVFAWEALNNRDVACDQRSDIWSLALCVSPLFRAAYFVVKPDSLKIYVLVSSTHLFSSKGMYGSIRILVKIVWYCDQTPEAWCGRFKEDPFPIWVLALRTYHMYIKVEPISRWSRRPLEKRGKDFHQK
jgi:hypothetical protein